jgi:hypothetical protein
MSPAQCSTKATSDSVIGICAARGVVVGLADLLGFGPLVVWAALAPVSARGDDPRLGFCAGKAPAADWPLGFPCTFAL